MKSRPYSIPLLVVILVWFAAFPLGAQTLLFSDNFNRTTEAAGDTALLYDVDFSTTGMGGTLVTGGTLSASNAWLEPVDIGTATESKSQISTNDRLLLAVGLGTSHIVLSNNFATQISTSGVLSVQINVPEWPTLDGTPLHRYMGIGVGGSEAEFNFNGDRALSRVADLFVALTQDGRVRINDNTPFDRAASGDVAPSSIIDLDSGSTAFVPGTLRLDLRIPGTGFGETVVYDVFFDSGSGFVKIAADRTFAWSGQDELYIGLDARTTGQAPGDDFSITFTPGSITPEVTLAVTPDVMGASTASTPVTLTFSTIAVPSGATYRIAADKAVTFPFGGDAGSADFPSPVQVEVNGTLGDVTFTIYISNSIPALIASATAKVTALPEAAPLVSTFMADTFNRTLTSPNVNDIDSGTDGMSGSLAPITYLETWEGGSLGTTNYVESTTIIGFDTHGNEVCSMANGPVMSMFGIDHNFTDAAILSQGGFSMAFDVTDINSATDDAGDRYSGFGVGLSLDEINAFVDENGGNLSGPRGAIQDAFRHAGMADFYVSLAINNNLQVFAGGVLIEEINVSTNRGRIRADFGIADFNAGSFVAYKVYFDNLLRGQGFFRWTADNQNYVAVSSRGSTHVTIDNLAIGMANVPFTAPAPHPQFNIALTSLTPATPPFASAEVQFPSVAGVTYRADVAASVIDPFLPAGGSVGGEAVFAATNSLTSGTFNVPPANVDSSFFRVKPVHWPGPVQP